MKLKRCSKCKQRFKTASKWKGMVLCDDCLKGAIARLGR